MFETKFSCDVCGTVRKQVNKWFVSIPGQGIRILGFTEKLGRKKGNICLCGENCLHAHIAQVAPTLHPTPIPENGEGESNAAI